MALKLYNRGGVYNEETPSQIVYTIPLDTATGEEPADGATRVKAANYAPQSPDQQITIATLATSQALSVPSGASVAILQNNTTQAIRWRDTGSAPTVSVGQRIPAGESLTYDGSLSAIRLIREADGTGTLDVAYYS